MAIELPTFVEGLKKLYRFSVIKLVAMDLDGTLLQSENPKVFEPITELYSSLRHKYHVQLTFATGRTLTAVRPFLSQLALEDNVPLILYNGSLTVSNTTFQVIGNTHKVSRSGLRRIVDLAFPLGVPVLAYSYENLFGVNEPVECVFGWSRDRRQKTDFNGLEIRWMDSADTIPYEPLAVLLDVAELSPDSFGLLNGLKSMPGISITRSGSRFIEIRPSNSNKGTALRFVAAQLGLSRREVVALGDSDNDLEMLRWAGIGVVVRGASDGALQASDYVCRYGAAQGAVELLRLIRDSHRYFKRAEDYELVRGEIE